MAGLLINSLYNYPSLSRSTVEGGPRFYLDPNTGNPLPSVTTILDYTKDKTHLIEWANRIGQKKADEIRDEAARLGTLMHTHLECHIQSQPRPGGTNLIRQMATRMADVIINQGLVHVDEVWGYEIPLYFPELYAGTTDLVGVYKGKPAIMDYKNTKKMKSKDMIPDYFCQGAAYALSHNYLFDTNIQTVVIFMVSRDLKYETFVVEGDEFEHYASEWQKRLVQYDELGGPRGYPPGARIEEQMIA